MKICSNIRYLFLGCFCFGGRFVLKKRAKYGEKVFFVDLRGIAKIGEQGIVITGKIGGEGLPHCFYLPCPLIFESFFSEEETSIFFVLQFYIFNFWVVYFDDVVVLPLKVLDISRGRGWGCQYIFLLDGFIFLTFIILEMLAPFGSILFTLKGRFIMMVSEFWGVVVFLFIYFRIFLWVILVLWMVEYL